MKTRKILTHIPFIFALFIGLNCFSQSSLNANELSKEWMLFNEQEGVKLFTRQEDCKVGPLKKPLTYIFLKVENNNASAKDIYLQFGLHFDEECVGCDGNPESLKAINIAANSALECDCNFEKGELSLLINNPNFADTRIFESLELINFKVD